MAYYSCQLYTDEMSRKLDIPPPLLPFPDGTVWESATRLFSRFTFREIQNIENGNQGNDPARSLLEGRMRPWLIREQLAADQDQTPLFAYRAGTCVGLTAVRMRLHQIEQQGFTVPDMQFDSQITPAFIQHELACQLLPSTVAEYPEFATRFNNHHVVSKQNTALAGLLAVWLNGDIISQASSELVSLGVSDVLSLYQELYSASVASVVADSTLHTM